MSQLDEFALIGAYFKRANSHLDAAIDLGIGDDGALFRVAPEHQCVVSSDLLIEGRHFFADVAPRALGHKALAVNLSDLAAMGAQPIGFTLSIGLPQVDETWLAEFAAGMFALADAHQCALIGGDTTRSPTVVVNITVFGQLPNGSAILRSGAQAGDAIYVTGALGAPAYALAQWRAQVHGAVQTRDWASARARLEFPEPRVAFGKALRARGWAHSMLDLSDGLAGDLAHITRASRLRARVNLDALPLHPSVQHLPFPQALAYASTGGDEYELCFTAKAAQAVDSALQSLAQAHQLQLTRIGEMVRADASGAIDWHSEQAADVAARLNSGALDGFKHF